MVDLQTQYEFIREQVDSSVLEIFKKGTFINGPSVKEFQSQLEDYLNVKHVIPCANGTDALQIALMSLDLKPGDEIITSNFTFAATVEVIALLKLKPVLVDIEEDTFNINCDEIIKAITIKTKAIMRRRGVLPELPMCEYRMRRFHHNRRRGRRRRCQGRRLRLTAPRSARSFASTPACPP